MWQGDDHFSTRAGRIDFRNGCVVEATLTISLDPWGAIYEVGRGESISFNCALGEAGWVEIHIERLAVFINGQGDSRISTTFPPVFNRLPRGVSMEPDSELKTAAAIAREPPPPHLANWWRSISGRPGLMGQLSSSIALSLRIGFEDPPIQLDAINELRVSSLGERTKWFFAVAEVATWHSTSRVRIWDTMPSDDS